MKVYHGVKGERVSIVEKQNKRIIKSQSASYGSMTFWKNIDFWQSVLLYSTLLILSTYIISLIQ
jgi:hypothetical protein